MNSKSLLYAGLVAFGVAVLVVVVLKCFCFLGEFLNSQRNQILGSQQQPITAAIRLMAPYELSAPENESMNNSSSTSSIPYNVRRLSERIYVICFEQTAANNVQQRPKSTQHDSPPSYEEAVRLIIDRATDDPASDTHQPQQH